MDFIYFLFARQYMNSLSSADDWYNTLEIPYSGKFSPEKIFAKSSLYHCGNFCRIYFCTCTFIANRHVHAVTKKMRKAAQQDQGALHYTMAEPSYSVAKP